MQEVIADICCLIYYVIATISTLPTIVRVMRRKSSKDMSLVGTVLSAVGGTCWTVYIFLTHQTWLVYIGSAWDFLVLLVYTIVVFKYHNRSEECVK